MRLPRLLLTLSLLPWLITATSVPDKNKCPSKAKSPSKTTNPDDDDNTNCVTWCNSNFANPSHDCIVPAQSHKGPCFQCGPQAVKNKHKARNNNGGSTTSQKPLLCRERCVDASTDAQNCGRCNNHCTGGRECRDGLCQCPKGQKTCPGGDGTCKKSCEPVCAAPLVACGGVCVTPTVQEVLNSPCPCGVECAQPSYTCMAGTCQCIQGPQCVNQGVPICCGHPCEPDGSCQGQQR